MEIQVKATEGLIVFDFDNYKTMLEEFLNRYRDYKIDDVKTAKEDRAFLNKFRDAVDGKRIEVKKKILQIYNNSFEPQMEELVRLIDDVSQNIDIQIREVEHGIKDKKYRDEKELWERYNKEHLGDIVIPFEKVFNSRWVYNTTSITSVKTDMLEKIDKIKLEMETLRNINKSYLIPKYLLTMDLNKTIADDKLVQDKRKEVGIDTSTNKTVAIRLYGSENQLKEIGQWLRDNGYQFSQVGEIEDYE
jgi:hypothetical protein